MTCVKSTMAILALSVACNVIGSASAQNDSEKPSRRGFSRPPRSGESSDLRKTPTSGQRNRIRRLRERTENGPVPPELEQRTIRVGNTEREFFINIPDSVKGKPSPAIFVLHGGASNSGLAMHLKTDFTVLGKKRDMLRYIPAE